MSQLLFAHPLSIAWPLGSLLLTVGIFTTTYPQYIDSLRYLRLALAIPCLQLIAISWFPQGIKSGSAALLYTGNVILFLKAVDILVIGFFDTRQDVPRWVALNWKRQEKDDKEVLEKEPLPLPTRFKDRVLYAIDSLTTIQGRSFFKGRAFDWAPPVISAYRSGGRSSALKARIKRIVISILMSDFFSTALEAHQWNIDSLHPLTHSGMALPQQLLYVALVGGFLNSVNFLIVDFYIFGLILLGSDPDSWAPLHRSPESAATLAELWSYRWHIALRRGFQRVSRPFVKAFKGPKAQRMCRIIISFALTTVFHLGVPFAMEHTRHRMQFWEPSTLKFYLSQPVGLAIEIYFVLPKTEPLPHRWRAALRRVYLWGWLLLTGRWYADQFIRQDVFKEIPRYWPFHVLYATYVN